MQISKVILLILFFPLCFITGCASLGDGITYLEDWVRDDFKRDERAYAKYRDKLESELSKIESKIGDKVYIRAFKDEKELEVWIINDGNVRLFKTYPVCKISGELGPKKKEGDEQVPEGFYYVTNASLKENSDFHLAFNINYPNRYDEYLGRDGSSIMVHGYCFSTGCFAVRGYIDEIYVLVKKALESGQQSVPIDTFPFRMSEHNMNKYKGNSSLYPYSFWENIKEGYDYFETKRKVPGVIVKIEKGRPVYVFQSYGERSVDLRRSR